MGTKVTSDSLRAKVYHGAPHGISNGYEDALNADLLSFLTTGQFPA